MAVLSIKDFPDDVMIAIKVTAAQQRISQREYITQALKDSLPAANYPTNETEVPATGRTRP